MIHINRFIDKVKACESRHNTNLLLTMQEARDLHGDITKLLLALREIADIGEQAEEITKIEITGENW